jgi:hypothetical protein
MISLNETVVASIVTRLARLRKSRPVSAVPDASMSEAFERFV